jgi:PEP-CTERM motif
MTTVLNPTTLAAGTYVLEIRGDVTGSSGGTYSGELNLNPVPLPAALPLLLSGLGLLGFARKRRV